MNDINHNATIGEMVSERLDRSRVFEKYGLDYCCGGGKTVTEACADKGIDPDAVFGDLKKAETDSPESQSEDYSQMSLGSLVDHIVQTHHAYLKAELPRLGGLLTKVVNKHGENDKRLYQVQDVFHAFAAELESHWTREERILFPMIKSLDARDQKPAFPPGMLPNPIRVMEREHENAGAALANLRELTDNFTPPEFACNTYKAMLAAMVELESDTHVHIHKENNILFPRAVARESELSGITRS